MQTPSPTKQIALSTAIALALLVFPTHAQPLNKPVILVEANVASATLNPGQSATLTASVTNFGDVPTAGGSLLWGADLPKYCWRSWPAGDTSAAVNALAIGDADNDGQNEIIVGTAGQDIYAYEGAQNDWEQSTIDNNIGDDILSIAVGDWDENASNEVLVGTAGNEIIIYAWDGDEWTQASLETFSDPVKALVIANADDDAKNELLAAVGNDVKIYDYHRIFQYTGSPAWYWDNLPNKGAAVLSLAVGDYDDDATPEIVFGNDSDDFYVYSGSYSPGAHPTEGSWTWTQEGSKSDVGGDVKAIAVGNPDNDGDNDIVIGTAASDVYMYSSSLTKYTITENLGDGPVNCVIIADSDNDGQNEVVVGNAGTTWPDDDGDAVWSFNYKAADDTWQRSFVGAWDNDVLSLAVGDADNDTNNEIARGQQDGQIKVSRWGAFGHFYSSVLHFGMLMPGQNAIETAEVTGPAVNDQTTYTLQATGYYTDMYEKHYDYPDIYGLAFLGLPTAANTADIALEPQSNPDINNDGFINLLDFAQLAANWLQNYP